MLSNNKRNFKCVNLASIANNKGFVLENHNNIQADLTGLGEYFLLRNIVNASIYESGSYIFALPDFNHHYDNVSCTGQLVEINIKGINEVHVLGCSEWGNSIVNFTVEYEFDYTEMIELMVTDLSCEPMYKEFAAIQGTTQRNEGGTVVTIQELAFINVLSFATDFERKIKRIQLPDNFNYHILSISLSML
ncbi:hypothetical protein [Paenibacillus piscarius]|uniref:hypothetical protein n=1 Tax=Paenibacillus piscarius TaxID=1089681 RepID=UPI001EE7F5D9|nr:hypothetical protein [Paenibacillus piscarius]